MPYIHNLRTCYAIVMRDQHIKMDIKEIWHGLDSCGSGWGSMAGSCEHSNEPSDSIDSGEFVD
jgi:hypothetical protein